MSTSTDTPIQIVAMWFSASVTGFTSMHQCRPILAVSPQIRTRRHGHATFAAEARRLRCALRYFYFFNILIARAALRRPSSRLSARGTHMPGHAHGVYHFRRVSKQRRQRFTSNARSRCIYFFIAILVVKCLYFSSIATFTQYFICQAWHKCSRFI
jgi:hypothetical protein